MRRFAHWGGQTLALALLFTAPAAVHAGSYDVSGSLAIEGRWFPEEPQSEQQLEGVQVSAVLEPQLDLENDARTQQLSFVPFLRIDGRDEQRTHFDLREAYWRYIGDDWELLAGVNTVFWGVTESRHLINIINTVDAVEDVDEEDWLGQPMVQLALQRDWGRLEGFALLGFRKRPAPGPKGRPRTPLPIDNDEARFESSAEDKRVDLALRYSHFIGDWDIGLSAFHGTGREPRLLVADSGDRLIPYYDLIEQLGADIQYTRDAWLFKLEALARAGQGDTFGAVVGGLEYTFFQVGGSALDLGVLFEYLYDGRDETAFPTVYDDDVFFGARLGFNDAQDTAILGGAVVDREDGSTAVSIEAERRLASRFKLELEARMFFNVSATNNLAPFAQDSFVNLRLAFFL